MEFSRHFWRNGEYLPTEPACRQVLHLLKDTYVPSKPRTESSASRGSSNSTKAKPGGFRATQTFFNGPYLENAASISCFEASLPRLPTYTLHATSQSRWRDMLNFFCKINHKIDLKIVHYKSSSCFNINNSKKTLISYLLSKMRPKCSRTPLKDAEMAE